MDADRWERKRERWERRWQRRACYSPGRHLFSGLLFVTLGMIFLLGNMGLVNVDAILRFWPVILIALGTYRLIEAGDNYGESSGIFWIVVGGFFLLGTLGIFRVAFHNFWPIILIGFGAMLLWRTMLSQNRGGRPPWGSWDFGDQNRTGTCNGPTPSSSFSEGAPGASSTQTEDPNYSNLSHFSATAIFGGFERRINSQDFRGGEATVAMGGGKIDLRRASITAPHQPVIRVFAMFGGIEIRIPDDWTVVSEVELILGGFNDKNTDPPKVETKRLIIRGQVIFGGIEVKN